MDSKKELRIAYGLAVILLIVGVISYAAFSAKVPEEPIRLMFQTAAGKVLFHTNCIPMPEAMASPVTIAPSPGR